MKYPNIPLAQTVIQLCKLKNIKNIIISPGSRNAPLTIGFANDPFFKCYSIVDERCAAFFALGIAQQIDMPVVVVCTSGSALLNFYPAVAEAFYSEIPLVVLSADRPAHLQNIGDGQTINQEDLYKNHILYTANLKLEADQNDYKSGQVKDGKTETHNHDTVLENHMLTYNETEINTALNRCISHYGPVHINVPFNEPLYETTSVLKVVPEVMEVEAKPKVVDFDQLEKCLGIWEKSQRKMVLIGAYAPNKIEQRWLDKLAVDDSVIVFTESTSNVRHDTFFPNIDKIIAPLDDADFMKLKPEILLTFGGMVISKKIKSFLRQYQPDEHWHISETRAYDTYFCLTQHIKVDPNYFLGQFLSRTEPTTSKYKPYWASVKAYRAEKHSHYMQSVPFSDFTVFDTLFKKLPNNTILQVGNSSAIRYAQLFDVNPSIKVYCNRGTSGIDGSTSTAIGCAITNRQQTNFITGDLSFFYDSNALWNAYIPDSFRIIMINNGGGGIFRILPGYEDTKLFNTFFETKHRFSAQHLAAMYNFEYKKVENEQELDGSLTDFFEKSKRPKLLEIVTGNQLNDQILLRYFEEIK